MTAATVVGADGRRRCPWPGSDPDYLAYHDEEWGRPTHDEIELFEKLCLEGLQSGLSWLTILRKRPALRAAFARFEPDRLATYGPGDVDRLLADPTIVRNRAKIEAVIGNARALLELHEREESLSTLVWEHAPEPRPAPGSMTDVPARTPESAALAKALKARGMRFVGPTTCYALMQAMGVVDDHLVGCWARGAGQREG